MTPVPDVKIPRRWHIQLVSDGVQEVVFNNVLYSIDLLQGVLMSNL
jgi:hypothetical protein